jgi:hypothetical protein
MGSECLAGNCGMSTGCNKSLRSANLPANFAPYKGMTKTLTSLLISAALSMPMFAQSDAPRPNAYLDEVFHPKLKTEEQVAELVRKAGFSPDVNEFATIQSWCIMSVFFTIDSLDGTNLQFFTKVRDLKRDEFQRRNELMSQIAANTPKGQFTSTLRIIVKDGVPMLAAFVLVPNHGATAADVTAAVEQLNKVVQGAYYIRLSK